MKIRLHKLSFLSAFLLTLLITACNRPSSPGSESNTQPTANVETTAAPKSDTKSQSTAHVYPEVIVTRFMEACAKDRGAKVEAVCRCSIKEIQNKYSLEEFKKVLQDTKASGKPSEQIREIIQSCRSSNSWEGDSWGARDWWHRSLIDATEDFPAKNGAIRAVDKLGCSFFE